MGKPMAFSIHKYCECVEKKKADALAAQTKFSNGISQRMRISQMVRAGHYVTVFTTAKPPPALPPASVPFVPSF